MSDAMPLQPSLRRLRQFGVRPDRDLGQNFLIDSNILGVIARAAALGCEDVVLEIGGGVGVLTEHLAPRVGHVHVIEVDTRLHEALLDATQPFENVTTHWGDAMQLDLAGLSPAPTKVVANLPYGIAAGVLLRTIEQLARARLWVAMLQREVAERLAGAPGSGEYGVSSVIAQLACQVRVLRPVPRTVFYPAPNVDSALVEMVRIAPAPSAALRSFVRACFAHRRKALPRSLALALARGDRELAGAGIPPGQLSRESAQRALVSLGHPVDIRAERLSPAEFAELARVLGI